MINPIPTDIEISGITVIANLFEDLEIVLKQKLDALGITPKPISSSAAAVTKSKKGRLKRLFLAYFNAVNRRLPPRKYNVHYSKELKAKLSSLSSVEQEGIENIRRDAVNGNNLLKYFSTTISKDYKDPLFDDWQVIHFHLGSKKSDPEEFVGRTKNLLYAHATRTDIYFIDVLDHDPANGFANKELVEIINRNWPHITKRSALQGLKPDIPITNEQRVNLRKANVGSLLTLEDGTNLVHIGFGDMGSIIQMDRFFDNLRVLESNIRKNPWGYLNSLRRHPQSRRTVLDEAQNLLDVKLIDCPTGFKVIDQVTQCMIMEFQLER